MSLEEAAKELEKLELKMHQRAAGKEDRGDESNISAEDWGFEGKGSDDDLNINGDNRVAFRRRRLVSKEGREGCPAMEDEKGARGGNGGLPHGDPSPTQTHLHRTGSIDIEGGGRLASSSRSRSHNTADLSASGTGTADAWRWSRDAPWVTATLDRDGGMRSSFGGDNLSFSAVGEKGIGGIPRGASREWRTEADVDLSDIKATMRRIDGAGASTSGYARNTFGFDASASIQGAAAAASSRSATGAPFAAGMFLDREPFRDETASRAYDAHEDRLGSGLLSSSIAGGGGMGEGSGKWGGDSGRVPCSGASYGSKAVLASLRALQNKIRKLESERDHASMEASTLRREITALKSDHERAAQMSEAQAQEKTLASRLAYERLQADKIAADVRLRKAEERKRLLVREAEVTKERSAAAEAARQTAESRVRTLEDRLLGSGRQEKTRVVEARAAEEATARAREKADRIEALQSKMGQLEASVEAEKTLRKEAEDGLARALSDKGKLEHFLEGILRVNEELVKARSGDKTRKKVKRPKAGMAAYRGGGESGSGHMGEGFNVGSHTAKRATVRARKVKQNKRVAGATATSAFARDLVDPPTRGVLGRGHSLAHVVSKQRKSACKAAKKGSVVGRGSGSAGSAAAEVAVPFVASGTGRESFNVVSAVSKAVRAARRGRPRESLDVLYAEIGNAAVESTRDVASMFDGGNGGTSCRQQQRQQARPPRRAASTARKGRAVLDVSMPDLRGLNLDSPSFSHQGGLEMDDLEDGLEASESKQQWRRAVGLDDAAPSSKREGNRRGKAGVLRRGTQGGEQEQPKGCTEDGKTYGMWSNERYEDIVDVDGNNQQDENIDEQQEDTGEEAVRFGNLAGQARGGKGSPATDAGISSGDERERIWESVHSRARSRSSGLA